MDIAEKIPRIGTIPLLRWSNFSLTRKFLIMGGLVVILGTIIIGSWVARQIEEGATDNAAVSAALYVDSLISTLTYELEKKDTFSDDRILALDEVFKNSSVGKKLISVKIWKIDGSIFYSTDHDLIGQHFEITDDLLAASNGRVVASFDSLDDQEDERERATGKPLLEIYSPVRSPSSGDVLAVAEFYQDGSALKVAIANARFKSWLIVAAIMSAMAGALMTIVFQGSRTIDRQKLALSKRLDEVTKTAEQNRRLRNRVQKASEQVTELNEQFLKRTSAELHDGPAQLLSFASLRIGEVRKIENVKERDQELKLIGEALDSAMTEIRNLSRGLSLPEVDDLSAQDIIHQVIRNHTERTKIEVNSRLPKTDIPVSKPVKIAIYRFIQEALNNGWKHAPGSKIAVDCDYDEVTGLLSVDVSDGGPGFDPREQEGDTRSLGISGLRERMRSIGGELKIESSPGGRTRLGLRVNLLGDLEMTG